MKKIDTSAITSGSWMPVVGNYGGNNFVNGGNPGSFAGLDFLQQAYAECISALAQFIVNDETQPTVMYIAPPPPPGPGRYQLAETGTQGFMYYQGEIYSFAFANLVATRIGGGPVYQNANIVTGFSGADPVTFSDSSVHNVHQVRQVAFSWSGTRNAGNLPDYDLWLDATSNSYANVLAQTTLNNFITATYNPFVAAYNANVNPTVIQVGSGGSAPAFGTGWSNSMGIPQHVGNYPNPLSFYIMWNRVYIWGEVSNSSVGNNSTIFTLPPGYCPMAVEEVFEVWNTGLQNVAGGHNLNPPYYLVITSGGAVQLLSNISSPGPARNITLSGISFTQGVHSSLTTFYTTAIADVATHTDSYSTSESYYSFSDFSDS
jgi:hypothetical protein